MLVVLLSERVSIFGRYSKFLSFFLSSVLKIRFITYDQETVLNYFLPTYSGGPAR